MSKKRNMSHKTGYVFDPSSIIRKLKYLRSSAWQAHYSHPRSFRNLSDLVEWEHLTDDSKRMICLGYIIGLDRTISELED